MSGDFIDSNVFVYLFDETDVHKRHVAQSVIAGALDAGTGSISYQVVQETLNVILRKLATPVSIPDSKAFLQNVLQPLWRVMPSTRLYTAGIDIQARYRFSFYDSMIVAAAMDAGCTRLLTEDLQDGQKIDGMVVENPFRPA